MALDADDGLLDVGFVDEEADLVELKLDLVDDLLHELPGALNDALHGRGRGEGPGLALDDALEKRMRRFMIQHTN